MLINLFMAPAGLYLCGRQIDRHSFPGAIASFKIHGDQSILNDYFGHLVTVMAMMENGVKLMNSSEISNMDGRFRRTLFRYRELRVFEKMLRREGVGLEGRVIMDAGCGAGVSTGMILERFRPSGVIAFDYMPEMIARARGKGLPVDFRVGDMRDTGCPDASVDAVFIVLALHHVVDWDRALREMYRVLRPGGVLLLEEPKEGGFSWRRLEETLVETGFIVSRRSDAVPFTIRSYLCRKPQKTPA